MKHQTPQVKISRLELITKLKSLIAKAKNMPLNELCKVGEYNNNRDIKYPQTKGECIVDEALTLLLSQAWVDDDPALDEIESALGPLDIDVNKPAYWQELFKLVDELID